MSIIRPLLIVDLDGARFGLDAMSVKESLWLPELSHIEEAPHYVVGLLNLRDLFIPVTDLNLRFGHIGRRYRLSDQIVVLEHEGRFMGLIVGEVCEVVELAVEAIHEPSQYDAKVQGGQHLVIGEARVGDEIVTLLDIKQLVSLQPVASSDVSPISNAFGEGFDAEQQTVFRARAKALQDSAINEDGSRLALAIVESAGEYLGIELETVQEFSEICNPVRIPCCPPHIAGAMSLRGTLLTLFDLQVALNLPPAGTLSGKVVVTRLGDETIGLMVDDVHDVIYLRQDLLQPAPAVLCEQHGSEIKGAVPYDGKMMVVLDLPALLAREAWIVNDNV